MNGLHQCRFEQICTGSLLNCHVLQVNPYVASAVEGWHSDGKQGDGSRARGVAAMMPRIYGPAMELLHTTGVAAGAHSHLQCRLSLQLYRAYAPGQKALLNYAAA